MSIQTVTANVRGVVQGVSFRYHTRRCALRLGICGFVKNMPDGSVYLEATGPKSALEELIEFLHVGPTFASVSSVQIHWLAEVEPFDTFDISY